MCLVHPRAKPSVFALSPTYKAFLLLYEITCLIMSNLYITYIVLRHLCITVLPLPFPSICTLQGPAVQCLFQSGYVPFEYAGEV